ncbi:hypothetical protein GCM10008929_14410 [Alkalibacterium psychrotolerans]
MQSKRSIDLKNDSGTTLVELLAAIAILSIIVTAFLAFFVQGARTNSRTNDMTEATFIAQEEMEEIVHYSQTMTFENLQSQDRFNSSGNTLNSSYTASGYTVKTSIRKMEDTERLFTVIVEVENAAGRQAVMENRLTFE